MQRNECHYGQRVPVCVNTFWPYQQQDEIQSTMDETPNNRTIIISHTKEATAETRRLVSQAILNTPNTRNSGKPRSTKGKWSKCASSHVWTRKWLLKRASLRPYKNNRRAFLRHILLSLGIPLIFICWLRHFMGGMSTIASYDLHSEREIIQ